MKAIFAGTLALALAVLSIQSSLADGWRKAQTLTSVTENNVDGEVVQITVAGKVDNSAHCANPSGYALRDADTMKGSLVLLMSALMAEKHVDLFVTGTCDATGMPNVVGLTIH